MLRRILLAILLTLGCLDLQAETNSPAWKRAEHLRHGINASEWLAQSHDYSPQRLRTFTTLDDIARMHTMGFDHVRLSIDPAIFQCDGAWNQCEKVQALDEVVAKALSVDLAVILDIHPSDDYKRQLSSSDAAAQKFSQLWERVAGYYSKQNPEMVFFEVLNEPELRARLGANGLHRVSDRFTWRRTAEGTAEHYYLELEAHRRRRHDTGRGDAGHAA